MASKISNKIIIFDTIDSTQKKAKELIEQGKENNGLVIIAKKQIKGIGRLERSWESPIGGLWMSSIYEVDATKIDLSGFSVKLGIIISNAFEKILNKKFKIKWPNDVFLLNKKVAGILIDLITKDAEKTKVIIGFGLNVNFNLEQLPKELSKNATTLKEAFHHMFDLQKLINLVVSCQNFLIEQLEYGKEFELLDIWEEKSITFGKKISARIDNETIKGIEKGLTKKGHLKIEKEDTSEILLEVGEIEELRRISI